MLSDIGRVLFLLCFSASIPAFSVCASPSVDLSGTVVDTLGNPLSGAVVVLKGLDLYDTSSEVGDFAFGGTTASGGKTVSVEDRTSFGGNRVLLSLSSRQYVSVEVFNAKGILLSSVIGSELSAGTHMIPVRTEMFGAGMLFVRVSRNGSSRTFKMQTGLNRSSAGPAISVGTPVAGLARIASDAVDTLVCSLPGYAESKLPLESYTAGSLEIIMREAVVPVTGMHLSPLSAELVVGGPSVLLAATVTPSNASDTSVNWFSADTTVASVVAGTVTPVSVGSSVIYATASGGFRDSCLVTVTADVAGVSIDSSVMTLTYGGGNAVLVAEISPSYASNQSTAWFSSDTFVVKVDNGVVTPVTPGSAFVYVVTADSGFSDTCTITVLKAVPEVTVWPTASALVYGQSLAASILGDAEIVTPGVFVFSDTSTVPMAGITSFTVIFIPADTVDFLTVRNDVDVSVSRAVPLITTWPTASAITSGFKLSASVLSGGASVTAGSFAFLYPDSVLPVDTILHTVVFRPSDTLNYLTVDSTASVAATAPRYGMKTVPGGTFKMGSTAPSQSVGYNSDVLCGIVHLVTVSAFSIDSIEVNQGEYQRVMSGNPSSFRSALLPVEQVTWFDAVLYCNARSRMEGRDTAYTFTSATISGGRATALAGIQVDTSVKGYRLPTEAEWEYACKAGTDTAYYWGAAPAYNYAWYSNNSSSTTHPGALLSANSFGLYDMSGNVWEWCGDWYKSAYSSSAQTNPLGPDTTGTDRICRGGGWSFSVDRGISARRYHDLPTMAYDRLGFRVVLRP